MRHPLCPRVPAYICRPRHGSDDSRMCSDFRRSERGLALRWLCPSDAVLSPGECRPASTSMSGSPTPSPDAPSRHHAPQHCVPRLSLPGLPMRGWACPSTGRRAPRGHGPSHRPCTPPGSVQSWARNRCPTASDKQVTIRESCREATQLCTPSPWAAVGSGGGHVGWKRGYPHCEHRML